MLGLKRGVVKLIPYQSQWHDEFIKEKSFLLKILNENIKIEHVGSTAVESMIAKPIIDIVIGFTHQIKEDYIYNILSGNGYEDRGELDIKGDHLFAKGTENNRTHYLHIVEYNSDLWKNYLFFRDYLLKDKSAFEQYIVLKKELAVKFADNRKAYTDSKNKFIKKCLNKRTHDM